jgi:tetratricopeptide (TPR) repeat protein
MRYYCILHKFKGIFLLLIFTLILSLSLQARAQKNDPQLRLAKALEKNQEFNEALKIYKRLNVKYPKNVSVVGGIKRCYLALQNYDELITFLSNLVDNSNKIHTWQTDLAEAYFLNNQEQEALEIWWSQIESAGKNIAIYRIVALAMIRQRLYEQAIKVYSQAINSIKSQYNLHIDIANLYKVQLEYEKAAEHFLEYYLQQPKQKAFLQRQILNLTDRSHKITPVINALNRFLDAHPEQTSVYEIQAGIYIKDRNYDKAFEIYKKLDTKESDGRYLYKFALEAFTNGAYEYSITSYEILLSKFPESPYKIKTLYHMARAYTESAYEKREKMDEESADKNMAKAVLLFNDLIALSLKSEYHNRSYINLGDIYSKFYYDLDRASENYEAFINIHPDPKLRDEAIIKLGDVFLTKNQLEKAKDTFTNVTDKNYKNLAWFKICEIYFYQGEFNLAANEYEKLLQIIGIKHSLSNDVLSRKLLLNSFIQDSLALVEYAQAELMILQNKLSEATEKMYALSKTHLAISALAGKKSGELLFKLGKFEESAELLWNLKTSFPDNDYIDDIIFLLARVEEKLQNNTVALDLYRELLIEHSNSFHIQEAREKAREINSKLNKEQI